MDVEFAFLADAADAPREVAKLYVIGAGFDVIRARSFPVLHAYMSFVVKLRLHPTECDREHRLEIAIWDPDGQPVGPDLSTSFTAQRNPTDPTRPVFAQTVLNIVGLVFPRAGTYEFHVIVNGQHQKTVPLYLELAQGPTGSQPEDEPPVSGVEPTSGPS